MKSKFDIEQEIAKLTIQLQQLEEQQKLDQIRNLFPENEDVANYLSKYEGQQLLKNHNLDEFGVWEVRGEDQNCDYAGPHFEPLLGIVEGTLRKALVWAVAQPEFYAWGAGGSIKPHRPKEIIKL